MKHDCPKKSYGHEDAYCDVCDVPLYRINGGRKSFEVTVVTGRDHPTMRDYGVPCAEIVRVASCTSREAALAVLRLHEVEMFHDWTQPKAHWGMPLSSVRQSSTAGSKGVE